MEEYLGHSYLCPLKYHVAGLAPDSWREPETEVYLFTADVFGVEFKNI